MRFLNIALSVLAVVAYGRVGFKVWRNDWLESDERWLACLGIWLCALRMLV